MSENLQDAAFVPNYPGARALIEMHTSPEKILHLTHPRTARLRKLLASVAEQLDIPLVSWDAWLHALARTGKSIAAGKLIPCVFPASRLASTLPETRRTRRTDSSSLLLQNGLARSTLGRSDRIPRSSYLGSTARASSGRGTRWYTSSACPPRRRARRRRPSRTFRNSKRTSPPGGWQHGVPRASWRASTD